MSVLFALPVVAAIILYLCRASILACWYRCLRRCVRVTMPRIIQYERDRHTCRMFVLQINHLTRVIARLQSLTDWSAGGASDPIGMADAVREVSNCRLDLQARRRALQQRLKQMRRHICDEYSKFECRTYDRFLRQMRSV